MPLSTKGQSILEEMQKRYGTERGKKVFYAKENKSRKFRRVVASRGGRVRRG